jgi:glycosyltransferase involved in cell wall biosynthesis
MRVGLNLTFLVARSGGAGEYARALAPALLAQRPDLRIVAFAGTSVSRADVESDWGREVEWVRWPVKGEGVPLHLPLQLGALPLVARRKRLDVIHAPAYVVPPYSPVPTVATVHDTTWLRRPEVIPGATGVVWRRLMPFLARRADRVITGTAAARDEDVLPLGVAPERIDVVHHGVEPPRPVDGEAVSAIRERLRLGEGPVILCPAQLREHKNLATLIRAVAQLDVPAVRLVLPGAPTEHGEQLRALTAELGAEETVVFPGWIERDDLDALYATAAVVGLISFEEGFGLPVIEAMGRGVPVVCSTIAPLEEVAGDAALLVDPRDVASVAEGLRRALLDEAEVERLKRLGPPRAAEFSWARTAQGTLASYEAAIAGRRR